MGKCGPRHQADKLGIRYQIAPEQPAGLLSKPIGPLEAGTLNESGSPLSQSCYDIEAAANADDDACTEMLPLIFNKAFLPRNTHRDEQDLGATCRDCLSARSGLLGIKVSVGAATNVQAGVPSLERGGCGSHRSIIRAQKIDANVLSRCTSTQQVNEIDSRDALRQRLSLQMRDPDNGLTVRHRPSRAFDEALQPRVRTHHHQNGDIDGAQDATLSRPNSPEYCLGHLSGRETVKAAIQNVNGEVIFGFRI